MTRIEYTKHFVSGILVGINVAEFIVVDTATVEQHWKILASYTQINPGLDSITGTKFYVTGIRAIPNAAIARAAA